MLPFEQTKVRLYGDEALAQTYIGAARRLLFQVKQIVQLTGVPVYALTQEIEGGYIQATYHGGITAVTVDVRGVPGGDSSEKEKPKELPVGLFVQTSAKGYRTGEDDNEVLETWLITPKGKMWTEFPGRVHRNSDLVNEGDIYQDYHYYGDFYLERRAAEFCYAHGIGDDASKYTMVGGLAPPLGKYQQGQKQSWIAYSSDGELRYIHSEFPYTSYFPGWYNPSNPDGDIKQIILRISEQPLAGEVDESVYELTADRPPLFDDGNSKGHRGFNILDISSDGRRVLFTECNESSWNWYIGRPTMNATCVYELRIDEALSSVEWVCLYGGESWGSSGQAKGEYGDSLIEEMAFSDFNYDYYVYKQIINIDPDNQGGSVEFDGPYFMSNTERSEYLEEIESVVSEGHPITVTRNNSVEEYRNKWIAGAYYAKDGSVVPVWVTVEVKKERRESVSAAEPAGSIGWSVDPDNDSSSYTINEFGLSAEIQTAFHITGKCVVASPSGEISFTIETDTPSTVVSLSSVEAEANGTMQPIPGEHHDAFSFINTMNNTFSKGSIRMTGDVTGSVTFGTPDNTESESNVSAQQSGHSIEEDAYTWYWRDGGSWREYRSAKKTGELQRGSASMSFGAYDIDYPYLEPGDDHVMFLYLEDASWNLMDALEVFVARAAGGRAYFLQAFSCVGLSDGEMYTSYQTSPILTPGGIVGERTDWPDAKDMLWGITEQEYLGDPEWRTPAMLRDCCSINPITEQVVAHTLYPTTWVGKYSREYPIPKLEGVDDPWKDPYGKALFRTEIELPINPNYEVEVDEQGTYRLKEVGNG